jgi:hypothetical protein
MITHRMNVRRQLRSARVSALTTEERRAELLEAQARITGESPAPTPSNVPISPAASPEPPGREPRVL